MKTIGVLFGGKTAEHEISLISAKNVIGAIDKEKYKVVPIGIGKDGGFRLYEGDNYIENGDDPKTVKLGDDFAEATFVNVGIIPLDGNEKIQLDVVFPVLHGTFGEDGTMQGLLKIMDIPFVGVDVLGSAVGMDKDVMKRLLRDADISISDFMTFDETERAAINFESIERQLCLPVFIKPANAGSSVGISKATDEASFDQAIDEAFRYDRKIVIEEMVKGREIEVSVLGNVDPEASLPGEVIPHHEFYSYEAKYLDENGASFEIPVKLDEDIIKQIQETAIKTFKALNCEGMARVDGFLTEEGKFFINEINTIPGFTKISMYPKLWEVSGLPYPKLIDRLIDLAFERHERDKKIKTNFEA